MGLLPWVKAQFLDSNANPVANGLVFTYQAGTSTLQPTYSDSALTVPNANPLTLDSGGYAPTSLFLSPVSYKVMLKTATGVPLWTVDAVPGS
jgi:hypothetical protein